VVTARELTQTLRARSAELAKAASILIAHYQASRVMLFGSLANGTHDEHSDVDLAVEVTHARANLFKLLDQTAQSHEPIQITGRRQNGVLLSEDDFRAMQETLYLLSVPGMKASLRKARKAPLKAYSKTRPW
jgi:antitoxin YefM